jgi:hypothetical protein
MLPFDHFSLAQFTGREMVVMVQSYLISECLLVIAVSDVKIPSEIEFLHCFTVVQIISGSDDL